MRDQKPNLYPLTTAAEQRQHPESFRPHVIVAVVISIVMIVAVGVIVVVSDQPARRTVETVCETR